MARSALQSKVKIGQEPVPAASFVPALSVVASSFLAALPLIAEDGWLPSFGFLMLIAWRLRRPDPWPAWWAAPLGLVDDIVTGSPIGLSVSLWTLAMLALDFADRRTIWRDYWIEWALAALLILVSQFAQWQVASWMGARVPLTAMIPPLLISVAAFPLFAWTAARIDRWRFSRA